MKINAAITDLSLINQYYLEINSAEVSQGYINIVTLIESYRSSGGGNLYIKCDEIILYDQNKNEITLNMLKLAANQYWTKKGQIS